MDKYLSILVAFMVAVLLGVFGFIIYGYQKQAAYNETQIQHMGDITSRGNTISKFLDLFHL